MLSRNLVLMLVMLHPFYVTVPIVYYMVSSQDCNNGISYLYKQCNVSFHGWTMVERLCLLIRYKIYATQRMRNLCTMLLRKTIASWSGLNGRSSRTPRVLFQSMKKNSVHEKERESGRDTLFDMTRHQVFARGNQVDARHISANH